MLSGPTRPVETPDAFEHLCLDVFPDGPQGIRLLVYLTARFDESVNDQPGWPRVYTVAGWIAEAEDWRNQRASWNDALTRWELTRRGFHMTDFIGGFREYNSEEWQNGVRKKARYVHLCKIIRRNRLHGFGSVINTQDYDAVITPELAKAGLANRYYGFNIVRVMEDIEEWIDSQNYLEPVNVHYVFAQGAGKEADRDIAWLFNKLNEDAELRERFRISEQPYSMGDMKRDARMQPADILACLFNRYCARFAKTKVFATEPWWEILVDVLGGISAHPRLTQGLYNDKETLRNWLRYFASIEGVVTPVPKGFDGRP